MSESPDLDGQEGAEAYDALLDDETGQTNLEDRTFEELPDVEDLTQTAGDRDDDEALALDADEFDPDAIDDGDTEEDHELDYRAATQEREDDLDGQGPEDGFNEDRIARSEIDGLSEVADADRAQGGEDDFTDYEAKSASDDDLEDLGYSDAQGRAKRDGT
jgi:hypothetical protein